MKIFYAYAHKEGDCFGRRFLFGCSPLEAYRRMFNEPEACIADVAEAVDNGQLEMLELDTDDLLDGVELMF